MATKGITANQDSRTLNDEDLKLVEGDWERGKAVVAGVWRSGVGVRIGEGEVEVEVEDESSPVLKFAGKATVCVGLQALDSAGLKLICQYPGWAWGILPM